MATFSAILFLTSSSLITHVASQYNFLCDYSSIFTTNGVGTWTFSSLCEVDQLNAQTGNDASIIWLGEYSDSIYWTDYFIESTMQFQKTQPISNGLSVDTPAVGIMFRAKSLSEGYYLSTMYLNVVSNTSAMANSRVDANNFVQIGDAKTEFYLQSYVDYTLRVNVSGNQWTFYLDNPDGEEITRIRTADVTSAYSIGSIGFRTYRASAKFKTLFISGPGVKYPPTAAPTGQTINFCFFAKRYRTQII